MIILVFLSIVSYDALSQGSNNIVSASIKNESGLKVTPITAVRSENDYLGASYCTGTLITWISDLNKIGISEDKIKNSVTGLAKGLTKAGITQAKKAIMTTDTFSKEITVKFKIGNKTINICGIAKGSGMIAPNMATMLCFIFTDASIAKNALDKALEISVANSFNCITVDGCMSTNDAVMVLANGMAGNELINAEHNFSVFTKALQLVCLELAKMIVRDGEGATKFIRIKIAGAKSHKEAKSVALSIANSSLFKTAMFASSSNCLGRIVAAVGASGVDVKEKDLKVSHSLLTKKEVDFKVLLGRGKSEAIIYTTDLSYEYVKINAEYN